MYRSAIRSYQDVQYLADLPRENAAAAFMKAARLLHEASTQPPEQESYSSALRFNLSLWTIIQSSLLDPANELPLEIKSNILSLAWISTEGLPPNKGPIPLG
ncbi:MAG TPA: flagellar biosynthesis regulator FlaF [Syntrophales bacterium]|nr:flagellar biosynthesis regulator FlaF [Syntrophales bacterium]